MPDIGRGGKRRHVFRLEVHGRGLFRLPNMRSGPAAAQGNRAERPERAARPSLSRAAFAVTGIRAAP